MSIDNITDNSNIANNNYIAGTINDNKITDTDNNSIADNNTANNVVITSLTTSLTTTSL